MGEVAGSPFPPAGLGAGFADSGDTGRRGAFESEGGQRGRPAGVDLTDDVAVPDDHVVEEDLVELGLAVHLPQGPDLDAGLVHVEHEPGDARCFGTAGSVRARSIPKSA